MTSFERVLLADVQALIREVKPRRRLTRPLRRLTRRERTALEHGAWLGHKATMDLLDRQS